METITEITNENEYVDDFGPIGEKYSVCRNEVEQNSSRISKPKVKQAAVEHLNQEEGGRAKEAWLKDLSIIAWDLSEQRPADVPYHHAFELKDTTPIRSPRRCYSERRNEIVKMEMEMILKAKVIKPSNSVPGSQLVQSERKTEQRISA